ncbi:MAG: helix-turn-helix domain-containing protein [Phycisphaerae bacterium]|nr:helix-turn-helix domain-containing protein [Phycisphaerae bacterium]
MSHESDDKQFLTTYDVAQKTGRCLATVRRWIHNGTLKAVALPGGRRPSYLIAVKDFKDLLHNPATPEKETQP